MKDFFTFISIIFVIYYFKIPSIFSHFLMKFMRFFHLFSENFCEICGFHHVFHHFSWKNGEISEIHLIFHLFLVKIREMWIFAKTKSRSKPTSFENWIFRHMKGWCLFIDILGSQFLAHFDCFWLNREEGFIWRKFTTKIFFANFHEKKDEKWYQFH